MKKKKNRFLLFFFSFLHVAGEMYFGFMKTGVSLLSLFAVSSMVAGYTQVGVMAFVPFVIWVYGFFHANNMGALSDEEFYRLEDDYLFGLRGEEVESVRDAVAGKYRKALAVIMILLGITMLWQSFFRMLRHIVGDNFYYEYLSRITGIISNDVPRVIVAVIIIWFGIKLIQGKKEALDRLEDGKKTDRPSGNRGREEANMSGMGQNTAGSAGYPEAAVPVERIEQVEVVDNPAQNGGNMR